MLTPEAMSQVRILVEQDQVYPTVLCLATFGAFAPDHDDTPPSELVGTPGEDYRRIFNQAESRLEKICGYFPEAMACDTGKLRVIDDGTLATANLKLGDLWSELSQYEEKSRLLDEETREIRQLESTLKNFSNLSIDLGRLSRPQTFLDIRVGITPRNNFDKMQKALGLAGYLVHPYLFAEDQVHLVVTGPRDARTAEAERILKSAAFRDFVIPTELHDAPEVVDARLQKQRARIAADRIELAERIAVWTQTHAPFLRQAAGVLAMAEPFVKVENAAHGEGRLTMISGWVPYAQLDGLREILKRELPAPSLIIARKPTDEEHQRVPSHVRRHPLLASFLTLVKQYGTPRYGEIDPTVLFAVSFVGMFGMMFGDVGHGLTIAAAALVMRRRLGGFTVVAVSAGISSALFGAAYGSIFGFEEIIHPLWRAPLSDPLLMLSIALAWGVVFLLLTDVLYIHNCLAESDIWGALLEVRGLAGIGLYLGILWAAYNGYFLGETGALPIALIISGLALFAVYRWRQVKAPFGERLMVVLVEAFEAVMGNISNTLSFLRVAAFSLNHVALAIAVFALADMLEPAGHWIMVVVGNLFILVLEGAIVTIQVLRLEYYEGFSRFYSGDGKPFLPLRLRGAVYTSGWEKSRSTANHKPNTEHAGGRAGIPG